MLDFQKHIVGGLPQRGIVAVERVMDFFLFLPLTWTWIRFFPESIFYWSLVSSADEFTSGRPDPIIVILTGASGFFLPYILLGFFPDFIEGDVFDLVD